MIRNRYQNRYQRRKEENNEEKETKTNKKKGLPKTKHVIRTRFSERRYTSFIYSLYLSTKHHIRLKG